MPKRLLIQVNKKTNRIARGAYYFLRRSIAYPKRISFNLRLAELVQKDWILKQETNKILARQIFNSTFNRMDIITRYLAIEEIFGLNNIGMDLYRKMQMKRGPFQNSEKPFFDLITRIEKVGFDPYSKIQIDMNQQLIDGSHRMACALYFGIKEIPLEVVPGKYNVIYDIKWFERAGFTSSEINTLKSKKHELFKKLGLYFSIILWPPAQEFFDEIEEDISKKYRIILSSDYYPNNSFNHLVKNIYSIDDIDDWKIEKKIRGMEVYPKRIRLILIEIPYPRFRKKILNNHDISVTVEQIKAEHRDNYKDRIENYFYDTIMHIGDNFHHNQHIINLFENINE